MKKKLPRVLIDLHKIKRNTETLFALTQKYHLAIDAVTKSVCGDPKIAQAILQNNVAHGMTREDVRASVGEPEKTHGYVQDGRFIELWIYSEFAWHELEEIIFENGFVIGWNIPDSVQKRLEQVAAVELLEKVPEQRTTSSFIPSQAVTSSQVDVTAKSQVAE